MNLQPQATAVVIPAATQETSIGGVDNASSNSDGDGIAELEDILKQKTFTRSEIDQLTALLLSRTTDNSAVTEKSSEPKNSDQQAIEYSYEDRASVPTRENMAKHLVPGAISTPAMKSKVLEDAASPAELAKAYMGSRPRQGSPSMLGLNNQLSRECVSTANNPPFKARSPVTSLLQKPFSDAGTSENGLVTPRYRGKSAIYCMARTPYARIHPATTFKDPDSTMVAHAGSFFSRKAIENDQLNGSKKQALKRRSSVLENDIGSVGPIRRIRQKPNLLHPKVSTLPSSDDTHSTHLYGASSDATEIPPSSNWNSHGHSFSKSTAHSSMPGTSSAFVPSQSIETAQKIFEQLDKFTPKGKSPDLKIDIGRGTSPKKITSTVLGSPSRRSTETTDALKVPHSSGDRRKENGPQKFISRHDPPFKISSMVEGASLRKAEVSSDERSPEIGVEVRMPNSNTSHDIKAADEDPLSSLVQPPKKRGFQMSAHEDYLEPEDDVQLNGPVSNPLNEGEANTGSAKKPVAILDVLSQNEKPAVAEQKSSPDSLLSRKDPELISNGPVTTSNSTGFTFPAVPTSSPATSMGVPTTANAWPSALVSDDVMQQNESKLAVPDFVAKDKLPTLVFSTTSSAAESAVQKDTKLELPNSSNDQVSVANGSVEKDMKSTQGYSGDVKKSEDAPAPFSFGLHVSKQSLDNGVPSTIPATSTSSPNLFSNSFGQQNPVTSSVPSFLSGSISFSNGFASASTSSTAAPSGSSTNSIANLSPSISQLPSLVTASSVSSAPIFQFGTSTASSTSAASALVAADNSGAKSSEMAFGKTTSSSLFSPVTSTGESGIFGFNASTVKPANSEGLTAPAASSGSIFGFQGSSSAAPASTSTPSFPTQSCSSTSTTSVFGFSAATTPNSGLFGSGSASAVNPTAAATAASSAVSSSSGTTSTSIFGTNWQPSKPSFPTFSTTSSSTGFSFGATGTSTEANKTAVAFGSTNSSSSPGFSFGASATGTSTEANKTAVAFGSTNSSSSPAGNSSPFVFGGMANTSASSVFSFGGNTISSTPISTPAAPSQPAFGNNVSTPTFGFGSTSIGNGDQMTLEDSMAEDSMQPSSTPTPVFGQPPAPAPASGSFVFGQTPSTGFGGSAAPPLSTGNPFAFGSQPNQMASPSPSPFQPSGSVEFNAGGAGSFSLGASGDKGGRKYVKPRRLPKRK